MNKVIKSFGIIAALMLGNAGAAQAMSIVDATAVVETFDSMAATTNLPATGWKMGINSASPTWAGGTPNVRQQASSGAPSTGATYNWGATGGTERAVGAMTSGGFASPNSVMGAYTNDSASTITDLSVSFKIERYRINSAAASVQFYYSLDGSTWVAVTNGDIAAATIGTGASAYGFPRDTFTVPSFNITGLSLSAGSVIYLRWNLNTTGSNSQGIGLDDVSVTATLSGFVGPAAPASLVATATSPTSIQANWAPNSSNDPVMVAWATNASFGAPSGTYVASDPITGGGTVLYVGAATTATHTGRSEGTIYYYRAWSVRDSTNYSAGITANATTPVGAVPWLAITNPPLASNYVLSAVTQYVVQGVASNLTGNMSYSNRATGVVGTFAASSNWSVTVDLAYGGNLLVLSGTSAAAIVAAPVTTLVYRANPPVIPSPTDALVWINEFHYDNSGTDLNEGVEIAGPAGTDLGTYSLVFYSGTSGYTYQTNVLSGTIDDESCGFGAVWFAIAGIQNGQTDGLSNADAIMLVKDTTNVVQFISYEGTMQALNGPGEGYQSIDVGTSEDGNTALATGSIQLGGGVGTNLAAFFWSGPNPNSAGTLNASSAQAITGCAGNQAPILATIGAKTASAGSPLTFQVTAQDFIDGDTIVLAATNLPAGAVFDAVTNVASVTNTFTWSSPGPAGTYTVYFLATDDDGTDSEAVTITVTNPPAGTPLIAITNPATSPLDVAFTTTTYSVQGTGTNLVDLLTWTNRGNAYNGTATADVTWVAAGIPLNIGTNVVIVRGTNVDGIAVSATTIIRRAGGFVSAPVWINEINYDLAIANDPGEYVEIAGPAGTDLSAYRIVLYNGANSLSYLTLNLSGVIDDEGCGYGALSFVIGTNAFQNGAPDGLALVATQSLGVVQYLSYEGTMSAVDGPAFGLTSTDVGAQTGTVETLQLLGTGTTYGAFAWVTNAPSAGSLNAGQSACTGGGTDDDGDLIPNAWEALYFGGNTNATATDDSDVPPDGFSNLQEYIAGTDPTNSASYLKLDAILNSNVTGRALSFGSVTGRVYAIDWIVDLTLGNWSNLQSNIPGTGAPISIDDPSTDTNRAYRLGVKLAP